MKRSSIFFGVIFNILLTVNLYADVMQKTIHFQGFLTDSNDVAVMDNVYTMTFSLWDNSDNENPIAKKLWEETQQISVSRGIYSTNLGETSPFPYTLNFSQQYYLGVQVGNEGIMKINGSLIPIVSTWHAFRSDTAGGRNVKSINANYLLDKTDDIILTTGTIMINLRSAADIPEKWYTIKKMDDESTTVSIHTSNGELINDRTSWEISKQFTDLSIISNGLQWFSVGVSEISGITTTQLSDNAITSEKIADGSITGSDIQNSAIGTTQLGDNTITSAKIVDGTITGSDINNSAIGTTQLADNAVTSAKIIDGTITGSDIQNSAVDTTQLADNAVTSAKIIDGTITGSDIQNSAVDTTQLADNAITSDKISDATITSADLADSSILPSKLSGNPGNGNNGSILISKGDGTFDWGESGGVFDTTPAVSASLAFSIASINPVDVALDNSGKIYIAEKNGHSIMVYTASGDFSYSIGTGESSDETGSFNSPVSVDIDNNGKIYVCESNGNRVQVFTADGNYSYSIGASGPKTNLEGFYFPAGIALDNNGAIYVTDTVVNKRIMVFTASGSFDYSISVPCQYCKDLAVDDSGKIYLSDNNNHCVHVFASGTYSYSIGSGISGTAPGDFKNPNDVAIDSNGNIYVAEKAGDRIQVFTASGVYDYSITHNDINNSIGICVDNNKIYIAATINNVLVFNLPSPTYHSVQSAYIGIGTATPTETLEVDGNIKVNNDLILSTGSSSVSQTVLKAMSQSEARTITLPDASGIVVVTDDGNINIPDGSITASKLANNPGNGAAGEILISKGDGSFDWGESGGVFDTTSIDSASLAYSFASVYPVDVVLDNSGNIYVAEGNKHRIMVYTASGDFSYTIGTGEYSDAIGSFKSPVSIDVDSNGNVYVCEVNGHRVQVFTAGGAYAYSIGASGPKTNLEGFYSPTGIALDSNGKIYVTDTKYNKRIMVFTASGSYDYSISVPSNETNHYCNDLTVDDNGKIYLTDNSNHCVHVFSSGSYSYSIGTGQGTSPGEFNQPYDVAVDSSGKIYVSEKGNERIQVLTAPDTFEYSITNYVDGPYGIYIHNNKIYIASNYEDRVVIYNLHIHLIL